MNKQEFLFKWCSDSNYDKMRIDLESVIFNEIAKTKAQLTKQSESSLEKLKEMHKYKIINALNNGNKIVWESPYSTQRIWTLRIPGDKWVDELGASGPINDLIKSIDEFSENWELYEPEKAPTEPNSQVILDNSFDRERFERMFCAVVASGRTERWEEDFKFTEEALAKLDAYNESKQKGGNNA